MPYVHGAVGGLPVCSINDELHVGSHATAIKGVISAATLEANSTGDCHVGAITSSKCVYILRAQTNSDWTVVGKHDLPKRLSAIKFAENPLCVVVADTTGDVFRLPLDKDCNLNENETFENYFLLGHFSLVTDVSIRNDKIATCDRDNRVRVSRFPQSFVIENFFLGHLDFVTCVEWINDERLLSTSGDATICIWDVSNSSVNPAAQLKLPGDADNSTVVISAAVDPTNRDIAVITVDNSPNLFVLTGASRGAELKLAFVHTVDGHTPVNGAFFDSLGTLYASTQDCRDIRRFRVTLPEPQKDIEQISLESLESIRLKHCEDAQLDSSVAHARARWLTRLRRKPIVENWKGKKRKTLS